MRSFVRALIIGSCFLTSLSAETLRFSFGQPRQGESGIMVAADATYSPERGYGWSGPAGREEKALGVTSVEPFFFHVNLPEGNYHVRATLGGTPEATKTSIKAESRRLMAKDVETEPNQSAEVEFLVNVRTPALPGGGSVALKPREVGALHWDDLLTLELGGERPTVAAVEISPAPDAVTVYLAGDSTVTDQQGEPYCGWGQMLPRYFDPVVAVANHAESGLSIRSFVAQRRLEKVLSMLQPGDFVMVQFAHNDQKESGEGIGPFDSYSKALADLVARVRERGGHPVFVTSMYRRRFSGNELQDTLGDYPVAMRRAGANHQVPLIDLHAMSKMIFEALGPEESKHAFLHHPANTFPGQEQPLRDDTHFSTYGGDLLARAVVEGIRSNVPELAEHLTEDLSPFNPGSPPPPKDWSLVPSPPVEFARPEGTEQPEKSTTDVTDAHR